jgi:hypothetical protein
VFEADYFAHRRTSQHREWIGLQLGNEIIQALSGAARNKTNRLCGAISPNCERYRHCTKVLEAIDDCRAL